MPLYVDEVVIVDGRSTDGTVSVARAVRRDVVVVREQRRGKGVALGSGFAVATGDVIIMLDADGSMDPQEIGWFVSPLQHGYDSVKGSRHVNGGGSEDLTWLRRAGTVLSLDWPAGSCTATTPTFATVTSPSDGSAWKFCSSNPTARD
ncbi:glycosyltransferase [Pseudarthrobacter sp. NamE5]|uniref:glycosyltransferase n=1 Tax=Pseudarthrobacter sp. NamE5 TaxID=2576839 RepID=UPI00352A30A3